MKKIKFIVNLLSLSTLSIGLLAGCSAPNKATSSSTDAPKATSTEPEHLVMSLNWSGEESQSVMNEIINIYNSQHPNVKWTIEPAFTEDKLLAQIAAGNPPSASMLKTTDFVPTFAAKGAIQSLEPWIKKDNFDLNQFAQASTYSASLLGHQYALPYFMDTYGLYYNKDLFAKAGIDHPPETLEELIEDAKKLTVTGPDGQYTQLGFLPQFVKESEGYLFGGRYATPEGKVTATDPNVVKGVTWLVDFWKAFDPDKIARFQSSNQGAASGLHPFTVGKVGMMISGEWFMPNIIKQAPNMNYGVAPIPYPSGHPEFKNVGSVGGNPMVIPKGAKDPEQAWELIKWLSTEGQRLGVQPKYYKDDLLAVPSLKELANNPTLAPSEQMAFFWKYSGEKNVTPFPPIPEAATFGKQLSTNIQQAEMGKMTVQQALEDVQKQIAPMVDSEIKAWQESGQK